MPKFDQVSTCIVGVRNVQFTPTSQTADLVWDPRTGASLEITLGRADGQNIGIVLHPSYTPTEGDRLRIRVIHTSGYGTLLRITWPDTFLFEHYADQFPSLDRDVTL